MESFLLFGFHSQTYDSFISFYIIEFFLKIHHILVLIFSSCKYNLGLDFRNYPEEGHWFQGSHREGLCTVQVHYNILLILSKYFLLANRLAVFS